MHSTHALHIYPRMCFTDTLRVSCRQSDNNSVASIHFLWEQSLLSSLFLSESLNVRARALRHKDTHSHSRWMLLTLSTSASVYLFFSHLPCHWWVPDMTEPPSCLAPHGCLSAWETIGTGANLPLQRGRAASPFLPTALPLSPYISLLHLSFSLSVNCDNSLICHRPLCVFLGVFQEASCCKRDGELCDWVKHGDWSEVKANRALLCEQTHYCLHVGWHC